MRSIVVINDNSQYAKHAASVALIIAQKNKANLLLANLMAHNEIAQVDAGIVHAYSHYYESDESNAIDLVTYLKMQQGTGGGYKPEIANLDAVNLNENELADLLNKHNAWMVLHGCGYNETNDISLLNPYLLLNVIKCPLMFVPPTCSPQGFERIVYMTDLRYCRSSVVRYLSEFARPYMSQLLLGHLSASGLPDMALDYALSFFKETLGSVINYNQLAFSNIKERKVEKAFDVLIQGMGTDMLVLMNHQYHFKEVLGRSISSNQLPYTSIPVMVFPF